MLPVPSVKAVTLNPSTDIVLKVKPPPGFDITNPAEYLIMTTPEPPAPPESPTLFPPPPPPPVLGVPAIAVS
jgi:hypothetical protein